MFSDTQFWRLVWKEYRTQLPLWLTLLIGTPVLQGALLVLDWYVNGGGVEMGLLVIAYLASVVYVLGCGATLFSAEHETGTFDFQRVLPANQPRVFWAKTGFALVSGAALLLLLWTVTRVALVPALPQAGSWFLGLGWLFLVEVFFWSILCSLLIRQPLWGVIAAISAQSLTIHVVLPYLANLHDAGAFQWTWADERLTSWRVAAIVIVVIADIVLGKLWFEDRLRLPRWRLRRKPDFAPSYPLDAELPPYHGQRQIGWSRLLWLGWRDGRWVIGGLLAWYGFCVWQLNQTGEQQFIRILTFFGGSFLCGLFAFAPDQSGGRLRFYTERGCSPRVVWISRQVIWLVPVLIMTAGVIGLCLRHADWFSRNPGQESFEWAAAVIGPFVCYAAGQFAAMLFRSTVVAIAVGLMLTVFGIIWSNLMTSWLAPTWWAVGSLPVIGLFVTWLKANDWVEERRDRVARWRFVIGLGIPIVLLLAACATYRVVQIPVVTLPAEWGESDVPMPLTAAESKTLDLYRRALTEFESNDKRVANNETRIERSRQEHPDWSDDQRYRAAFDGFRKDWLTVQSSVVPLLREAHAHAPIPLALLQPDLASFSDDIWMPDKAVQFPTLMVRHARLLVESGQLDEAWDEIEVTWELLRRYWLRAAPVHMMRQIEVVVEGNESMLWEVIAEWGRHPDQSRDRIVRAIRRLEQLAKGTDSARHLIHSRLLTAKLSLFPDQQPRQDIHNLMFRSRGGIESTWLWTVWRIQPWEWWRTERVLRWRASLVMAHIQAVSQRVEDRPFVLGDWSHMRGWDLAREALCSTTLMPENITWGLQVEAERIVLAQAESFRATMLRLALLDWQREHGRLPRSLSELVPTYFAEIPRDPQTAGHVVYFPHGRGEDVTDGAEGTQDFRIIVQKQRPFLALFGGGHEAPQTHFDNDVWEFTDRNGKSLSLSAALRFARVWYIENDDPGSDP